MRHDSIFTDGKSELHEIVSTKENCWSSNSRETQKFGATRTGPEGELLGMCDLTGTCNLRSLIN
jgi:hypothetical protein